MSRPRFLVYGADFSFPRVSGDEPSAATSLEQLAAFSPRERG